MCIDNSLDNFYYENFKKTTERFYSWESFIINAACNSSDLNLQSDKNITVEGKKNLSLYLHEYTHFLQNFSTPWGIPVFVDLALSFFKIGASKLGSKEKLIPYYDFNSYTNLLKDGLELRHSVQERIIKNSQVTTKRTIGNSKQIILSINPNFVVIENDFLTCNIGVKFFRENMAHFGAQLYLNLSDDAIHEHNKLISADFMEDPEYWIIFEYFYTNFPNIKNLGKGLFYLSQHCLSDTDPSTAFLRFISWFNKTTKRNLTNINFQELFFDWLSCSGESSIIANSIAKSFYHVYRVSKLIKRNKDDNDLFLFANKIIDYCSNNLLPYSQGYNLFDYTFDFTDYNSWKEKIISHGTGIIKYFDGTVIHGTKGHCYLMEVPFQYLMSASTVLQKLEKGRIANCPFQDDLPICTLPEKDSNCIKNPFLHNNPASQKQCLFRNGIILLGLEERIDFGS